jgi:S1-C subfamily serine protease
MRTLVAALLGGAVAVLLGALLIGTDVIDVGDTTTVVRSQAPLSNSAGDESGDEEAGALTVRDIAQKDSPGVVFVQVEVSQRTTNPFGFPEQERGEATGTGFVLNKDGYIATNAHVVDNGRKVQVTFNDGDPVKAKVVGEDLSTDLAVVKVDPSDAKLTPLPLGDSSKAHVGDPVVAIGNPFGYDHTVTTGIVSAIGRQIQAPNDFSIGDAIQTDAAINPGNSGGPLIDANARVIGINSQIATNGGSKGNVGIGFAIPVNLAKQVLPQLIKTGEVKHAYIGVTTAPVTPSIADALKLPVDRGALVQEVASGSPASRAGIKAGRTATSQQGLVGGGDVIIGVDGKTIATPDDVAAAIADNKPGDRVQIRLYRGKSQKTVSLTLGNRPERAP